MFNERSVLCARDVALIKNIHFGDMCIPAIKYPRRQADATCIYLKTTQFAYPPKIPRNKGKKPKRDSVLVSPPSRAIRLSGWTGGPSLVCSPRRTHSTASLTAEPA